MYLSREGTMILSEGKGADGGGEGGGGSIWGERRSGEGGAKLLVNVYLGKVVPLEHEKHIIFRYSLIMKPIPIYIHIIQSKL